MRKYTVIFIFAFSFLRSYGQIIYTLTGNGSQGFSGDGGPAFLGQINRPARTAVDATGNIYIADQLNYRIRKITPSGIITTIAGTGTSGYSGDGGPATSAQLKGPYGITVDASGNIYFPDNPNFCIRKINNAGIISTIAGIGVWGFSGDGGLATSAKLGSAAAVAVDALGNIYIADSDNNRIRKINTSGIITTIAGTGTFGYSGDGGTATAAQLNNPVGIAIDASSNIYIAHQQNARIRKINTSGIITTVAGIGSYGFSGDGGIATLAEFNNPTDIAVDAFGNLYIGDLNNQRIRKVNSSGTITTIAGTGIGGYSGNGGAPNLAQINGPNGVCVDGTGNIYISDCLNDRIRIICASSCLASVETYFNKEGFSIFPNPNNGTFKFRIENEIKDGELVLINSLGQKVHEQKISKGENNIITNGLAKGLYNYLVLEDNLQISRGKLAIE